MSRPGYLPYLPQLLPVAWADDVWTVDGPEIAYRLAGVALPCPTRMTVVRLPGVGLWLHSPVAYDVELARLLSGLGPITALVAPNTHHHLHMASWAEAFPTAIVHASPDLVAKHRDRSAHWKPLGAPPPAAWGGVIDQLLVDLGRFKEAVFFHRPSRTMIITDLMQNFEADRIASPIKRWLLSVGGATGPHGQASIEIRAASLGKRRQIVEARRHMIAWQPDGVILSHGRPYQVDAIGEIERAFAWAGK